ncbi:hypothetical protein KXD93_10740 [Mucilaginibacter sp. BJC16-A38]|uniref:sensor histidine kinase n=1 Tax=Mucilaginibacter phenanthrenivorans TaxID=1234842 RepID=UPI002157100D|nr:histidine kinase [Mucilaginibacter phenanthrenivorans]MCR8558124.1 hypothetical protein [Mucilaginibacter phenanthrenivorans]
MQKTSDNIFILLLLGIGGVFMLVVSFVIIFIRNQNKLLQKQKQLQQAEMAHQQQLLQTVIESQEAERKRIGQNLHDDVGTALSNLRLTIEAFNQDKPADADSFRRASKSIIDRVIQDVRHISHNLSPPGLEYYGFLGTLEELCEFTTQSSRLQVNITNNAGEAPDQLEQNAAISLYRVMQELLNNTLKHAGATEVHIDFDSEEDGVLISYHDNGCGLPLTDQKRGMGMLNIESRLRIIGATFNMESPDGKGFKMLIRIKNIAWT